MLELRHAPPDRAGPFRSPARALLRGWGTSSLLAAALVMTLKPAPATGTTAGQVIEVTAPAGAGQRAPAVSWEPALAGPPGSGTYLIVWEDDRNDDGTPAGPGRDLYAARIQPDGVQIDRGGVNFLDQNVRSGDQIEPSVVFAPLTALPVHFIAWTDPRNGIQDIYATRLQTGTNGGLTMTAIEPGGIAVTTSQNDTDGFPDVAFSGLTYLVAYQTNARSGGGVFIQGRRLRSNGDTDGDPVRLSGLAAGGLSPAVTSVGSSFIHAFESPLASIRVGRTPDMGTVGPITTSSVSTSTSAQTSVAIAPLGSDIFVAWQDARNADRDVYGALLDPVSLMPRGPDIAVSIGQGVQQQPAVAGDGTGGLVVWQDRRNTSANAQIFGSRLSSSGVVRDPGGFEVLTFNGNAFEAAIAKGPGNDYLVAAIRFGQPTRLFYRIIRDEDPAGIMTGSGRTQVLADGVQTATIGFGLARGPSGLPVVNGTQYDLTLTSTAPVVVEPDADPLRPGHQVLANNGVVGVSLRSTTREMVTVTVRSIEGTSEGQATVDFQNVVPQALNPRVLPLMPRSADDLRADYQFFDINGDREQGTRIEWLRNRAIVFDDGRTTVTSSATSRGEVWQFRIRPGDGIMRNPVWTESASVTVGNTPPVASNAVLENAMDRTRPPRTGDRIELSYNYVDADRDTQQAPRIRWTDRMDLNNPIGALNDARAIEGRDVIKGQIWQASVTPNDGFVFGNTITSNTLTVINTAPVADAGTRQEVLERRMVTLDGTNSSDNDPNDTLQFTWTQVRGQMVILDNPNAAQPTFTAPSVDNDANLQFDLVVSDGEESSSASRVAIDVRAVPDGDGDGLDDEEEMIEGTDPGLRDTDADLLGDGEEVANGTEPLDQDSDDDGLRDGQEGQACRNTCDPNPFADADADGTINALDPDADDDGLPDGLELGIDQPLGTGSMGGITIAGTNMSAGFFRADVDVGSTTDPTTRDSDGDGLSDGAEDANANGRVDSGESDPNDPLDPGISCTSDGDCPSPLVCVNGTCGERSGPITCDPLPSNLECCDGSSCRSSSTPVDAICVQGSPRAQCPATATPCAAGTCSSAPELPMPSDEGGCTCSAPRRPGSASVGAVLLVVGLAFVRRRRERRGGSSTLPPISVRSR